MQLQLDDVALFMRIVELGILSAAARERNVPVSQVTRSLARLEVAGSDYWAQWMAEIADGPVRAKHCATR